MTPPSALFVISRLKITYLLVSCRSGNKPRLVRDREVFHRILESTSLLITIVITVILRLLLARGDTIIIVWGFVFKVKLRREERQPKISHLSVLPKYEKDRLKATYRIIDDTDYKTATGTCRDVLVVGELLAGYFETVSTWTWIVEDTFFFVPGHVLDFDLVVIGTHV